MASFATLKWTTRVLGLTAECELLGCFLNQLSCDLFPQTNHHIIEESYSRMVLKNSTEEGTEEWKSTKKLISLTH